MLSASDSKISLQGLLLGGMVIGALGVLIDLTVSQASTVIALRRANPALRFRGLFGGALEVGHDHIAATETCSRSRRKRRSAAPCTSITPWVLRPELSCGRRRRSGAISNVIRSDLFRDQPCPQEGGGWAFLDFAGADYYGCHHFAA